MSWRFAEYPEVARRSHDRLTEQPPPNPIDNNTSSQRVVASNNLLGKFPTATALFEFCGGIITKNLRKPSLNNLAFVLNVAANLHVQVGRIGFFDDVHSVDWLLRLAVLVFLFLIVERSIEHRRAGEDSGQGIVIRGRNRVVLMVVAAGTGNCQTK